MNEDSARRRGGRTHLAAGLRAGRFHEKRGRREMRPSDQAALTSSASLRLWKGECECACEYAGSVVESVVGW